MEIITAKQGQATVTTLVGSVDALTAPQATQALLDQVEKGAVKLILDMDQIDFISSAGLRMILGAVKAARAQGGDLRLAGGVDDVRKVLRMSGFTAILKNYDDLATAVASFDA
jgi:anti-sigma B factor antagonist